MASPTPPTTQQSPPQHHDLPGRVLGLAVFLTGIVLLAVVFLSARGLFNEPLPPLPAAPSPAAAAAASGTPATSGPSPAIEIGRTFAHFLQRVVLLLLMCIAGSVTASKGIQLFFASRTLSPAPPAPTKPDATSP